MTRWLPASRPDIETDLERWRLVADGADALFARVVGLHTDQMECRPGCVDCCHPDLTVVHVEALAILLGLSRLDDQDLAPLRRAARDTARARCPLLDPAQRCAVYPLRPLLCRTHGLAVLQDAEVTLCPQNFRDGIPEDAVLDGNLLAAQLAVVDGLLDRGKSADRFAISRLILDGAAALQCAEPSLDGPGGE